MHYYKRNIGDYYKKAGRLTMLEHGAYTLLMDACYDRETFPTLSQAIDWCGAKLPEEVEAVTTVLNRFFTLKANKTYVQSRINDELSEYKEMGKKNKQIALDRERTKRERRVNDASTSGSRLEHETAPNHKPLTINQEPLTRVVSAKAQTQLDYSCWPEMPEQQTLADWISMRKRIKADVSQTVINQFGKELHIAYATGVTVDHCLAECISSNWRGFKFSWLKNQETSNAKNQRSAYPTRGERNEQAFREYIANIPPDGPDSGVLAGLIESKAGE